MRRILALALLALLAGSSPAAADPISLAIGALVTSIGSIGATVGAFVTGLGVLGKALISIGLSLALSFVSSLFRPKPKQAEGGVQSQIQIGGDVPRSAIFGKQATAGHIVYVNTSGSSNAVLEMVFAIGDSRHEGVSRVWVNGKEAGLTQPGADPYYVVDGFDGKLTLTFVPGTVDQSALASLVSSANPSGRWSTDHTLTGIAYIVARLQYDEKVFPNGVPQLLFEMEGLRLYDPRFDSTNGGTGAQRWDDPTTWVYSENPAVQLYNYQRGIFLNGERVLGMGLPASDLNTASYVAAANICDESVSLAGGGTEPRYRCGFIVSDGMQHSEVIDRFVEAMGGVIAERAGLYTVFAGVAQTSVVTITDGDLVLGRPRTFSAKKSRTERVNAVFGTYSNPDEQWKPVAFPAFTSDTFEADDGGERLAVNLDLAQVFSVTQAQRLAMIQRRLGRLQGTAEISLPFAYIRLEAGDWITWQSNRFGFTKVWQVASARIEADQSIRLSLREIATSVFSWISGDDELEVVQPGITPDRPPLIGALGSFDAAPVTIDGDNGSADPAFRATWDPIEDETVTAVIIEYRIGGSGEPRQARSINRLGGFAVIADGIQPNTAYQARGTIETTPARATTWSDWLAFSTADVRVTEDELDDAIKETLDKVDVVEQDTRDIIKSLSRNSLTRAEVKGKLDNGLHEAVRNLGLSLGYALARIEQTSGKLRDAGISIDPVAGTVRIEAVDRLRTATTTQFSEVSALFDSVNALISLRATKAELDAAIEAVVAGFQPAYRYEFNGTNEGWTGSNATLTPGTGSTVIAGTGAGAYAASPTLSLDADTNKIVALRVRRTAGSGWGLALQWGASFANSRAFAEPAVPGDWNIIRLDQNGQTDWEGTLTGLRLAVANGSSFEVDYIEIGNSALNDLIVGELSARISDLEIELDAANAAILLRATLADLGAATDRITVAELAIDAAEAAISGKVSNTEFEGVEARVTTAEFKLDALENQISFTIGALQDKSPLIKDLALADAKGQIDAFLRNKTVDQALAYARQVLGARIDENGTAIATFGLALIALTDSTTARFTDEATVRAAADAALSARATTLEAALNDPTTGLITRMATAETLIATKVDEDGATAIATERLEAMFGAGSAGVKMRLAALATPTGYDALFEIEASVTGSDGTYKASGLLIAVLTVEGVQVSRIQFKADQTQFLGDDGTPFAAFDSTTRTLLVERIRSGDINTVTKITRAVPGSSHNVGSGTTTTNNGNSFISSGTLGSVVIPENPGAIGEGATDDDYCPVLCFTKVRVVQPIQGYPIIVNSIEYRVRLIPSLGSNFTIASGMVLPVSVYTGSTMAYGYYPARESYVSDYTQVKAGTYDVSIEWRWSNDTGNALDANSIGIRLGADIIIDTRRR